MRRTEYLINDVREISRNLASPDGTVAVTDNTIIRYISEAQTRIQSLISSLKNVQRPFITYATITTVAGQDTYALPARVSMNKQVHSVMYSTDGNLSNFIVLTKLSLQNRDLSQANYPWGYLISNGNLVLVPQPSTAGAVVRVYYERQVDDVDIRRGSVTSVAGLTSTGFSSLSLSSLADTYETSVPGWSQTGTLPIDYISIINADGAAQAYAIPIGTYDTSANSLTPRTGFVFNTGESIVAGAWATFGKYSNTHSQLPDMCEPYLIQYAACKVLEQQSSDDAPVKAQFVAALERNILDQVKAQTAEIQPIPEANISEWY